MKRIVFSIAALLCFDSGISIFNACIMAFSDGLIFSKSRMVSSIFFGVNRLPSAVADLLSRKNFCSCARRLSNSANSFNIASGSLFFAIRKKYTAGFVPNAAEERKEKAQPMDKRTIFGKPALRFRDKHVFPVTIEGVLRFFPSDPVRV